MASQAHRGQVIIELLIVISLMLTFFWFADSLATDVNREQAKARFPSNSQFRK